MMTEIRTINDAFARFQSLTKRVVSAPKAKVDALAKKREETKRKASHSREAPFRTP